MGLKELCDGIHQVYREDNVPKAQREMYTVLPEMTLRPADAYDRLDKLSQLPEGKSSIRTLIKGPGGKKLIDLLTSSTGRPQAGELLAHSPSGHDFNQATGRIYTLDALVQRLEQSYRAAAEAAENGKDQAKKGRQR